MTRELSLEEHTCQQCSRENRPALEHLVNACHQNRERYVHAAYVHQIDDPWHSEIGQRHTSWEHFKLLLSASSFIAALCEVDPEAEELANEHEKALDERVIEEPRAAHRRQVLDLEGDGVCCTRKEHADHDHVDRCFVCIWLLLPLH